MVKIDGGYVLTPRKIMENELWVKKPALWLKIWNYIIMKVNHKDNKYFKRGTNLFLWKNVNADIPDLTQDIWGHCIKFLKQAEQIATQKAERGIVITALNYEIYQNPKNYKSGAQSGAQSGTEGEQKRNRSGTINKNDKNDNNTISENNLTIKSKVKDKEVFNTEGYFNKIWGRYPNNDGRKSAIRHYLLSVKTKEAWDNINKALDNYLKSERVKKGFIKNGSTWFNNWQDWIEYKDKISTGGEAVQKVEAETIIYPEITEEQRLENIKRAKELYTGKKFDR